MAERRAIPLRLRREVAQRAQRLCEYCRSPEAFSLDTFTIDHIRPVADSGSNESDNLAFACHNCNNRKQDDTSALDPISSQLVPLFHPRRDRWSDHFRWSDDVLTIVPITATGRATVARLQLNRTGAVNVRRALLSLGEEHPPSLDE
jgi:hypothetical protein